MLWLTHFVVSMLKHRVTDDYTSPATYSLASFQPVEYLCAAAYFGTTASCSASGHNIFFSAPFMPFPHHYRCNPHRVKHCMVCELLAMLERIATECCNYRTGARLCMASGGDSTPQPCYMPICCTSWYALACLAAQATPLLQSFHCSPVQMSACLSARLFATSSSSLVYCLSRFVPAFWFASCALQCPLATHLQLTACTLNSSCFIVKQSSHVQDTETTKSSASTDHLTQATRHQASCIAVTVLQQ